MGFRGLWGAFEQLVCILVAETVTEYGWCFFRISYSWERITTIHGPVTMTEQMFR